MRIESFWAKGYRSLRDVRIDNLGPFNVFYGPNGGGKSNILAGIELLLEMLRVAGPNLIYPNLSPQSAAKNVIATGLVARHDFYARDDSRTLLLGAHFVSGEAGKPVLESGPVKLIDLTIEVTLEWIVQADPRLSLSQITSAGRKIDVTGAIHSQSHRAPHLLALLSEVLPAQAFALIGAERSLGVEAKGGAPMPPTNNTVAWHLSRGQIKRALLQAQLDPSPATRRRLDMLRSLLAGPPLHRPPFAPTQDPTTGMVELHERLPDPNPEGLEIPINLAGLGIAQIYAILAKAMLMGTAAVGIEEPEAHLHAPTSGRALRTLLVRLVEEKFLDQLFIATHSNLFDLDPTGYFDVSLKDGCTVVTRSDLTRIDREHLYEPGPAKHALEKLLQYAPAEEIVFRRSDGRGVTAEEMMRLLQEDDALAVRFLEDVHGAAVRMVKIQSKKSA